MGEIMLKLLFSYIKKHFCKHEWISTNQTYCYQKGYGRERVYSRKIICAHCTAEKFEHIGNLYDDKML